MGAQTRLVVRLLNAVAAPALDAAEQPRHVLPQHAHRLQPLAVLAHIVGREAVDRIPVLRRDDGHVADGEILVELLEGGRGAAPAARDNRSADLARHAPLRRIEEPVEEGDKLPGRSAVIDRRADDQTVELLQPGLNLLHHVIAEAVPRLEAVAAGDAARQGLLAQIEHLGLDSVLLQRGGHLAQGRMGAALTVGAAVDKQYLHLHLSLIRRRDRAALRIKL